MKEYFRAWAGNGLVMAAGTLLPATALIGIWPGTGWAATYTVTNLNDSGAGSLRQAIADAGDGDTIIVDSSLSGGTITLGSSLPYLRSVTLEGGEGITVVQSTTGSTYAYALRVAGTLSGELPASIEATSPNGFAQGIYSGGADMTLETLSGTVSAKTTTQPTGAAGGTGAAHGLWTGYGGGNIAVGTLSGTVSATATGPNAYGLRSAGTITVDTLSATGAVSAKANATAVGLSSSGNLTVTDLSGTVSANAETRNATGLYATGFSSTASVGTLSGSVTAIAGTDYATGIGALNAVTLGTLSATGRVSATAGGDYAYGALTYFGDLSVADLSGTVSAKAGGDYAYGLYSESGTLTVTSLSDTGKVSAATDGSRAYGIYSAGAIALGSLSGTVTAAAGSYGAYGLYTANTLDDGAGGAAEISGTVSATANGLAVAVSAAQGMNLSVTGTLNATDTSGAGNAYAIAAGSASGSSWSLGGAYDDTVTLGNGASITGDIDLGGGTNLLTLFGAGTLVGDIGNITTLAKSGSGTWSTTGAINTSALSVSGGTLLVNVTQTATPTVTVSGTATNDGVISFALDDLMAPGTFTVLDAGSLAGSGTYASASAFLSASVDSANSDVNLTKLSFSDVFSDSDSTSQQLAEAIDDNYSSADDELSDLISAIEQASTLAEAQAAMDELTSLLLGQNVETSVATARLQSLTTQLRMAGMRAYRIAQADDGMPDPDDPGSWPQVAAIGDLSGLFNRSPENNPNGLHLRVVGRAGSMDSHDGYAGYDYDTALFSGGYDRMVGDHLLVGVSAGWAATGIDYKDAGGSGSTLGSYSLGVYASLFDKAWYVDGILSGDYNSYDLDRELSAQSATAKSETGGYTLSAKTEGGYRFDLGGFGLTPTASLEYTRFHLGGYTETGAGAANLAVDSYDTDFLESGFGAKLDHAWKAEHGLLVPEISAMWMHEWLSQGRNVTYSLTGLPGVVFSQPLAETGDDSLSLGVGLRYVVDSGLALTARYQGDFEEYGRGHSLLAEAQYVF